MASVEKRVRDGRARWYARYRDPNGRQRTKTFDRRVDAERFLTGIESAKLAGSYLDPARGRLTVGEWAAGWLDGLAHVKPSTRERYAGILREHILPRWGTVRLADVGHADVQRWVPSWPGPCRRPPCARSTGCSASSSPWRSRTTAWSATSLPA